MNVIIRREQLADHDLIFKLHVAAFETASEATLVNQLRESGTVQLSLVAELEGTIVGHLLLSRLFIETPTGDLPGLALAPMAVAPSLQRCGIGSRLVAESIEMARQRMERIIIVLGHPEFYPRFGFSSAVAEKLESPFSGEAWMALELVPNALDNVAGRVRYASPFGIT